LTSDAILIAGAFGLVGGQTVQRVAACGPALIDG